MPHLTEPYLSRMLALADFLETQVEDKEFNMECVREDIPDCGTVCCAIGLTPRLFPDLVEWKKGCCGNDFSVDPINPSDQLKATGWPFGYIASACHLFSISRFDANALFNMNRPSNRHWIAKSLREYATSGALPEDWKYEEPS